MRDSEWVKSAKKLARGYVAMNKAHTTHYATNGGRYTVFELAAQSRLGLIPKDTVSCIKPLDVTYPAAGRQLRVQEVRFYDVNEGVLQRTPRFLVSLTATDNGYWYTIILKRTEFWKRFKKEEP